MKKIFIQLTFSLILSFVVLNLLTLIMGYLSLKQNIVAVLLIHICIVPVHLLKLVKKINKRINHVPYAICIFGMSYWSILLWEKSLDGNDFYLITGSIALSQFITLMFFVSNERRRQRIRLK